MQTYPNLKERFNAPGPKRILTLDGGGIRGALTLGYLERIETILKVRYGDPDLKLCDHFDLIGGTSTGAIIAASLAIGKTVSEVKEQYLSLGGEIFGDKKGFMGISLDYKYDEKPLLSALENMFKDIRIGDEGENGLRTGLCVVTKRLDTFSTWPIVNHPDGRYFDRNRFLLREVVRASTAAPTYFVPEMIDLGDGHAGTFVDGGMSMMNNPSLQLFLIATVGGYPFRWKTGPKNLQLVSIGTGKRDVTLSAEKYRNPKLWEVASLAPEQFMHDASELVEMMMQYLSDSPTAREIDRLLGKMESPHKGEQAAMSYLRYNINLDKPGLESVGVTDLHDKQIRDLTEMDDAENRHILAKIGEKAAQKQVINEHFDDAFINN